MNNIKLQELTEAQIMDRYSVIASHISKAYTYILRYRANGKDAKLRVAESLCLSKTRAFLDSAVFGLFDNRDDWCLDNANFLLDYVRPSRSAGALDILLNKVSDSLSMLQNGITPDDADLTDTETLLRDIFEKITGKPPVYK